MKTKMARWFLMLGAVAMALMFWGVAAHADTYTAGDLVLTKPSKSGLNWDGKINGNFDVIAASAVTKASSQTFTGQNTFSNSVGIGTTTPVQKLEVWDVNRGVDTNGNIFIRTNDSAAQNAGGQLSMGGYGDGTTTGFAFASIAGRKEAAGGPPYYAGYLQFTTSNGGGTQTEKARIDSAGNMGIGTALPTSTLHVNGSAAFGSGVAQSSFTTTGALNMADNVGLKTYTETKSSAAVSSTYDVSWSSGSVYWLSLNDNTTLTFSGAVEGQSLTLFVKQNVGSKAITWPTVSWPSATAPTLTTTAGKTDIITLTYIGGVYYGFLGGLNY